MNRSISADIEVVPTDKTFLERWERRQRITKLTPDRSRWQNLPIPFHYSVEAEKAEQKFEALRRKTEISERTEAWRLLCGPTRRNLIDWLWSFAEQNPEVGKITGRT